MEKIIFRPVSYEVEITVPYPKSSINFIPQWYSSMSAFETKKPNFNQNGKANKTVKMCMPFKDALTTGYIQETWQDIYIENDGERFNYFFPTDPEIMSLRSSQTKIPVPDEYIPVDLVWRPSWIPQMPKGWSAIICHPMNRIDLPFYTLSGVIESDTFIAADPKSNFPLFLKKEFSGMIPKGTPMYQIIPFKRENWKSELKKFDLELIMKETSSLRQKFWGAYKERHWVKKVYE